MACYEEDDWEYLERMKARLLFRGELADMLFHTSSVAIENTVALPELIETWRADFMRLRSQTISNEKYERQLEENPRFAMLLKVDSLGSSLLCASCQVLDAAKLLDSCDKPVAVWWKRHCTHDASRGNVHTATPDLVREKKAYAVALREFESYWLAS
jgi:hypothetical protein